MPSLSYKQMIKKLFIVFMLLLSSTQFIKAQKTTFIESLQQPNRWVDSVFKSLNRREKIGQLFMVRAHTDKNKRYEDSVAHIISKEHIGGLVFFQGGPSRQVSLINRYQTLSKTPLWIAMDAEWGTAMRLDSIIPYPYQMTLGAIQNNDLLYKMGALVAKECKSLGIQINFAPVMDINNNPNNPVINYRSFGENKENVAIKSLLYMKGMQDQGLLTTAKHFPGHGDTETDSHFDLPQLNFTRKRLDSVEMYPFKKAISENVSGIMVAHMNIPSLDTTKNLPSTLSKPIVTTILKQQLGFKGLIFSDAMEMKGVVKYFPNGSADVKALIAGVDVIELSENSLHAEKVIRKAIHHHQLSWADINEKVKKILYAKYWAGLNIRKVIKETNVVNEINSPESALLKQQLADNAITLIKAAKDFYPTLNFISKTAVIDVSMAEMSVFSKNLKQNNDSFTFFNLSKTASVSEINLLINELNKYDRIILALHDLRKRPASTLDYSTHVKKFIANVAQKNTASVLFANPYSFNNLPGLENSKSIVIAYQDSKELEIAAAKLFNKEIDALGKLPVTINEQFKYGVGLQVR